MDISKRVIAIASVGLVQQQAWAFVSTTPPAAACTPQQPQLRYSRVSRPILDHSRATTNSGPAAALSSAKSAQRAEILEDLFGADDSASYNDRIEKGRAAQGLLTTDALVTRTLVPPRELTYGEYDLDFFLSLVTECLSLRTGADGNGNFAAFESEARSLVFGDIGSGCGRLVVAQALTWPWRACRGVEIVPSFHDIAEAALLAAAGRLEEEHETNLSSEAIDLLKTMAPCSFSLGDVNDDVDISDIDILFCYSSSFPAFGDLLTEFSYTLGHKLRPGAQVITTDRRLVSDGPWEFELLSEREGKNAETGGKSIAFIWRVVKSAL